MTWYVYILKKWNLDINAAKYYISSVNDLVNVIWNMIVSGCDDEIKVVRVFKKSFHYKKEVSPARKTEYF